MALKKKKTERLKNKNSGEKISQQTQAKRTDLATSKSKIIEFKVIRTKENKEKYFIIIQITY